MQFIFIIVYFLNNIFKHVVHGCASALCRLTLLLDLAKFGLIEVLYTYSGFIFTLWV